MTHVSLSVLRFAQRLLPAIRMCGGVRLQAAVEDMAKAAAEAVGGDIAVVWCDVMWCGVVWCGVVCCLKQHHNG